jgi:N-methylhydantoinase B
VYQEGLRIPGVKLFDRGVRNEAIVDILRANVRVPEQVLGNLDAEVSAAGVGERGYLRLIARHGAEAVADGAAALLDVAERRARAEIAGLPEGTNRFRTHIDHDSVDPQPVVIAATVTIDPAAGEHLVDLRGSSRQVRGGINSPFPFSASAVYAAVRLILDPDIPDNAGYFRAIPIRARKGAVVNPVLPAACWRTRDHRLRVM